MIECGASKIASGRRAPAVSGSSFSWGIIPSRVSWPTRAISRGVRMVVSVISRRNARPRLSANPLMTVKGSVTQSLGKDWMVREVRELRPVDALAHFTVTEQESDLLVLLVLHLVHLAPKDGELAPEGLRCSRCASWQCPEMSSHELQNTCN